MSGAEYVAAINAGRADRSARAAFQALVLASAKPGALLFDFGCGPGLDARHYAEHGYTVGAYDVDPQMCSYFTDYCRAQIEQGRIELNAGPYSEFLRSRSLRHGRDVALVTANFAPLNLVEDLSELFGKFAEMTLPDGQVLASLLSPYYLGDLRYRWWWSHLPALCRQGHYAVGTRPGSVMRRRVADVIEQASPHFTLVGAFPGRAARRGHAAGAPAARPWGAGRWLPLTTSRYMFLQFARCGR